MLEGAEYTPEEVALEKPVEDSGLAVALLEESFEQVKPQADAFINSFYDNLFTDYPAAKPLFEHTNMAKQKQMLLGALVMVVENLRKPEVLSEALKGLGARHVKYGALPEHYPLVGNSLLKTFEQYLDSNWTEEVKQAWVDAYGAITALMLEGAEYTPEEVALEKPVEDSGLAVALLEESFEQVKPQADAFINSFYDNLFTDYPAAKPLFEHTNMAKQKQMLLGALVMVVENLRKPEVLSESLKGLGARHVKYGALPEHYPLVGNSLLKTFEQYLDSNWTGEIKQAWVDAYGAITTLMLEGAEYAPQEVALDSSPPSMNTSDAPQAMIASVESPEPNWNVVYSLGGFGVAGIIMMLLLLLL
ncbi:MAG: globin [Symploca sp. SIO1A3]|nr:globin [Symploca sp. SIO1A3]